MSITPSRRGLGSAIALGIAATVLGIVPGGAPVPAAQAATGGGSIVYIKDHNVWLTDGDGSVHRQVTNGGTAADPWQSPTQSDNGVVVAHHGGIVYRMNQRGEVFNAFDPPDLYDAIGNTVSGRDLTETAISPDGARIAYTYFKLALGEKRWVTGFTAADHPTDPGQWGLAFYDKPSWVTNDRVVLNHWYRNKVHLYDLGRRDIPWFSESDYETNRKELSDMEVSRDGRWTVGVRGDVGDESIVVIPNGGEVRTSATPWKPVYGQTRYCNIGLADGDLHEPTIAPDGSTLAWAEPDGIYRASDMNCSSETRVDILLAPGGSDPAWSAAAIGQTPDLPAPGTGQHLTLEKKPKVSGAPRVGKKLKAKAGTWVPSPTSVTYQWTRDGKAIRGATKATYRLKRKDRGHKISVKITVGRSGYATTVKKTAAVRVR
ncbi:PD40 domain-containing protein [Nocardioides humi]|uniref:Uncharacterized protein n=1 Tax=Nocardioides humi TaxID=449461 RepID=A0ABN2AFX4_9ACTN|nr:PD40 domain-containing protein [Nocardioides humi]